MSHIFHFHFFIFKYPFRWGFYKKICCTALHFQRSYIVNNQGSETNVITFKPQCIACGNSQPLIQMFEKKIRYKEGFLTKHQIVGACFFFRLQFRTRT